MSDNVVHVRAACAGACAMCHASRLVAGAILRTSLVPETRAEGFTLFTQALSEVDALISKHEGVAGDFRV